MISFQNWKAVRSEALNLAPQLAQQTKSILQFWMLNDG